MDKLTDPLGYDVYAKTLWARIQTALNKDEGGKPLGDDPLVVGIFGEWGAGKSYLLKLIQKQAEQASKEQMAQRCLDPQAFEGAHTTLAVTVPVYFQPWKYEHEAHLHIPLAVHVADAMNKAWKDLRTGKEEVLAKINELEKDQEKIKKAKSVWHKASEFFGQADKALKSKTAQVVSAAADIGLAAVGAPPLMGLARKKLIGYTSPEDSEDTETEEHEESSGEIETKPEASAKTASTTPKKSVTDGIARKDDGLSFYRTDRLFQGLTRPMQNKAFLKDIGVSAASEIKYDLRINFVIFIDDLDRCLPEKAVQTLELIKTVFNVESFAFVLALDDEVIERGIGHRYKEYKLQDKKPEMPITGFEYLEKIVHLPFRLPGLTQAQARRFIVQYEKDTVEKGQPLWFSQMGVDLAAEPEGVDIQKSGSTGMKADLKSTELLDLVIASFDAYVPRKLIRTVELLRQVMQVVQLEHGKSITADGKPLDIRVILALLLMQLFQPELYRLVRRRSDVFPALYGGFVRKELFYPISDIDLWKWVTDFQVKPVRPSANNAQSKLVDALNPYEATVERIADIELSNDKADAQYVRLPLVTQLVEHRAVQRHVFNALRMTKDLAKLLYPIETLGEFSLYLSLLSANETLSDASPYPSVSKDQRQRFAVGDIQGLLEDLTSARAEVYENLAERNELKEGQVLDSASAKSLVAELKIWLQSLPIKESKQTNKPRVAMHKDRQTRLLHGLQFLASYIAQEDGAIFWSLVSDLGKDWLPNSNLPNTITPDPVKASLYLDVQSMLGQDDRFDHDETQDENGKTLKPLYLLKKRWKQNDEKQEPVPGFVRVSAGTYEVGDPEIDPNNPISKYTLAHDIFMGRTPVTVDQFGAFIKDGGYGKNANDEIAKQYWDDQGWAWIYEAPESVRDIPSGNDIREWTLHRSVALNSLPRGWDDQKGIGNRPVHDITWFEARAYVRWLNAQLLQRGKFIGDLQNYEVSLPNEWQWEVAARAQFKPQPAVFNRWPWGPDDSQAGLRANIEESHISHASVPGCFAPNEVGLLDMVGNVWEWQDSVFKRAGVIQAVTDSIHQHLPKHYQGVLKGDWDIRDALVVRGGSWFFDARFATCSYRNRIRAGGSDDVLGFRVMLSQRGLNN